MLSQAFIRTAFVYLIGGAGLGAFLLADKGLGIFSRLWELRPLHIEWLLHGWMLQLALGGANWIMPRPHHVKPRMILGWMSYGLLNSSLLLSALVRFISVMKPEIRLDFIFSMAALAQVSAVICFGVYIWGRASFALPFILLGNKPRK